MCCNTSYYYENSRNNYDWKDQRKRIARSAEDMAAAMIIVGVFSGILTFASMAKYDAEFNYQPANFTIRASELVVHNRQMSYKLSVLTREEGEMFGCYLMVPMHEFRANQTEITGYFHHRTGHCQLTLQPFEIITVLHVATLLLWITFILLGLDTFGLCCYLPRYLSAKEELLSKYRR